MNKKPLIPSIILSSVIILSFFITGCGGSGSSNILDAMESLMPSQGKPKSPKISFTITEGITPIRGGVGLPSGAALNNLPHESGRILGLHSITTADRLEVRRSDSTSDFVIDIRSYNVGRIDISAASYKDYSETWLGGQAVVLPATYDKALIVDYSRTISNAISSHVFIIENGNYDFTITMPTEPNVYVVHYFYDGISTINQILAKLSMEEQINFLSEFEYSKDIKIITDRLGGSFVPGFLALSDTFNFEGELKKPNLRIMYNDEVFEDAVNPPIDNVNGALYTVSNQHGILMPVAVYSNINRPNSFSSIALVHANDISRALHDASSTITLAYSLKSENSGKFDLNYSRIDLPALRSKFQRLHSTGKSLYIQNLGWDVNGGEENNTQWRCVTNKRTGDSFQIKLQKADNRNSQLDSVGLVTDFSEADFSTQDPNPNLASGICGRENWRLLADTTNDVEFNKTLELGVNNNPHLMSVQTNYILSAANGDYVIKYYEVAKSLRPPTRSIGLTTGRAIAIADSK